MAKVFNRLVDRLKGIPKDQTPEEFAKELVGKTLSEIQEDIYKREDSIKKLEQEITKLKEKEQLLTNLLEKPKPKELAELKEELAAKSLRIEQKTAKNIQFTEYLQTKLTLLKNNATPDAQQEINKHTALVVKHKAKQEEQKQKDDQKQQEQLKKEAQQLLAKQEKATKAEREKQQKAEKEKQEKLKKEAQAKAKQEKNQQLAQAKKESTYVEKRDKLLQILPQLMEPKVFAGILKAFAPEDSKGTKKFAAAMKGLSFALENLGAFTTLGLSASFFSTEAKHLQEMLAGKKTYDEANFFLRLANDPNTIQFLKTHQNLFSQIIAQSTPHIVRAIFKDVEQFEAIQKKWNKKKDQLPMREQELQSLNNAPNKDIKAIEKLEHKLTKLKALKANYERAFLLKNLKAAGINEQYINEKLLPTITQKLLSELLQSPQNLIEITTKAARMVSSQDTNEKNILLKEILDKVPLDIFTQHVGQLLSSEKAQLAMAGNIVIGANADLNNSLQSLGITQKLRSELLPATLSLTGQALNNPTNVTTLYEALKPVILYDAATKIKAATTIKEVREIDKAGAAKILDVAKILPTILLQDNSTMKSFRQMVQTLSTNKESVAMSAVNYLPQLITASHEGAKKLASTNTTLNQNEVYKIVVSPLVRLLTGADATLLKDVPQLVRSTLPLILDLAQSVLSNLPDDKIQAIYKDIQTFTSSDDPEAQDKAVATLLQHALNLTSDAQIKQILGQQLPAVLQTHSGAIADIAKNFIQTNPALKAYGIPAPLVENSVRLVTEITSPVLTHINDELKIYQAFNNYQELSIKIESDTNLSNEQRAALQHTQDALIVTMLQNTQTLVNTLDQNVVSSLQKYITDSTEHVIALLKQPQVVRQLTEAGLNPELQKNLPGLLPFVSDIIPVITKLAQSGLKNPEELQKLIMQIQDVMITPEQERTKKILELGKSLLKFKDTHPEIKKALGEIPDLLSKHAETLGPFIKSAIKSTKAGKILQLGDKEAQTILQKHSEQIAEITSNLTKGHYVRAIGKSVLLLAHPDMLGLAARSFGNFMSYIHQEYLVPYRRRERTIGTSVNVIMGDLLKTKPAKAGEKIDLALLFDQKVEHYNTHPPKPYPTILKHSLNHRNLSGLPLLGLKFENFKMQEFNLNKTKLHNCSFVNAELRECSFKGTTFKFDNPRDAALIFAGATIDAKTLKTLTPAIQEYNKSRKAEEQITFKGATLVGVLSEYTVKDALLEGAIFQAENTSAKRSSLAQEARQAAASISQNQLTTIPADNKDKAHAKRTKSNTIPGEVPGDESQVAKLLARGRAKSASNIRITGPNTP